MKEAAPEPKCGRRLPSEAEGMKPGKLWIPEEIGHHQNEEDPLWKSGTVQEKLYQEKLDQGQNGTRNLQRTDARDKTVAPGRQ
jgi:hypothetical protein